MFANTRRQNSAGSNKLLSIGRQRLRMRPGNNVRTLWTDCCGNRRRPMETTLKRTLTTLVGGICESPLLRSYVVRSARRSFNVVYYHFVGEAEPHYRSFYGGCTIDRFAQDL